MPVFAVPPVPLLPQTINIARELNHDCASLITFVIAVTVA
jgi:hypothetical protein